MNENKMMHTTCFWDSGLNTRTVPVFIALEDGRRPTLCALFAAASETNPVFWRASAHRKTKRLIVANINWMFNTSRFVGLPLPVAVLVGIPADVFFAALSGRLFGDDPADASGETAAIFRLALALLPGGVPLTDILAVVGRFGGRAWPFLGMGRIPEDVEESAYWLNLPSNFFHAFELETRRDYDNLLEALIAHPSGHSAYYRAPTLAAITTEEPDEANRHTE